MTGWRMLSGLVALLGLLWSTPGRAQAMPLRECRGELPPPWVTSGKMTEQVCFQTVLHAAGGYLPQGFNWKTSPEDSDDRLTAARGPRGIIAIRDWQPFSSQQMPDSGLLDFSGATVLESGETGEPGELWWGRVATGSYRCCANANIQVFSLNTDPLHKVNQSESLMLAVGQESSLREQASFRSLAQLQAYDQGRLPPWPAKARSLRYEQLAATAVTAQGSNPVAPGIVSSARVELTSLNPLQGNLQFTLAIGGLTGPLTIPMKRDVDESRFDPRLPLGTGHPFRLRRPGQCGGRRIRDRGRLLFPLQIQKSHAGLQLPRSGPAEPSEHLCQSGSSIFRPGNFLRGGGTIPCLGLRYAAAEPGSGALEN